MEVIDRYAKPAVLSLPVPISSIKRHEMPASGLVCACMRQPVGSAQSVQDEHSALPWLVLAHHNGIHTGFYSAFVKAAQHCCGPFASSLADQDVEAHFFPNMISSDLAIQRMDMAFSVGTFCTNRPSTM
jgi:hypothetical protein